MRMNLHTRPRGVASPALCPVQSSFGILTRDDRRRRPSLPLTPGSFTACLSTATASARLILSSAAASRAAALQQAFDPLPACFAVRLLSSLTRSQIPASRTTLTESPLLEVRPAKVLEVWAPSQRVSPFQLECRTHCHCHLDTTEQLALRVPSYR